MSLKKIFLYAETPVAVPFDKLDWRAIDAGLATQPGLRSKTWLAGIDDGIVGGLYEFDSVESARAYAEGPLAEAARRMGAALSVRLFDGDVAAEASRASRSPYFVETAFTAPEPEGAAKAEAQERAAAIDA